MPIRLRSFLVQPLTASGDAVLQARLLYAKNEDVAVKRLVRWMCWEGYEVEGLCVAVEEVPDDK
jgi:hypothetical protein